MRRNVVAGLGLIGILAALAWGASAWLERRSPDRWTAGNLLPNADWQQGDGSTAAGWRIVSGDARRVNQEQGFVLQGDYALRMYGMNTVARSPAIKVSAGQRYRLGLQALVDPGTQTGSDPATIQIWLHWIDAAQDDVRIDKQPPVSAGYTANGDPTWTPLLIESLPAPDNADQLALSIHLLGDDVIFIDNLSLNAAGVYIEPWPNGRAAAVSFSVDWETAMGGYIHTRATDPYTVEQATAMGMRSRAGTGTLLELLTRHQLAGTWFANGYNFLQGNQEQRRWMGDPTFAWASPANRWANDWSQKPWFSADPYGTVASDPGWYFGDLTQALRAAQQPIESHTFSHLNVGLSSLADWQADLATWQEVAGQPAAALAFPWGSSLGMSAAHWRAMEAAGVRTVVRTYLPADVAATASSGLAIRRLERQPRRLPGYDLLVLPDLQLAPQYVERDLAALRDTVAAGGVLDLWAHTSEITTPAEIATWDRLMGAAVQADTWVASVPDIGAYWRGIRQVRASLVADGTRLTVRLENPGASDLRGVTLRLPGNVARLESMQSVQFNADQLILDLAAGSSVEIDVWLQS